MTEEGRRVLSEAIVATAAALPYWRDAVVLMLAAFVIGCLELFAVLYVAPD